MGRPKGSKNKTYAEVFEIPATCPKCKSANLTVLRGNRRHVMEYNGTVNGVTYSHIEWVDKRCECGQRVRVKKYLAG
jgi:hypothetical protein